MDDRPCAEYAWLYFPWLRRGPGSSTTHWMAALEREAGQARAIPAVARVIWGQVRVGFAQEHRSTAHAYWSSIVHLRLLMCVIKEDPRPVLRNLIKMLSEANANPMPWNLRWLDTGKSLEDSYSGARGITQHIASRKLVMSSHWRSSLVLANFRAHL